MGYFKEFRESVMGFCGEYSSEKIKKYFARGIVYGKSVLYPGGDFFIVDKYISRSKTTQPHLFNKLKIREICRLSIDNYAKGGNLDALHIFLICQNTELEKKVFYMDDGKFVDTGIEVDDKFLPEIFDGEVRGDGLEIHRIPAVVAIVAEQKVKMHKYEDLGYEYCLLESGMALQNLYHLPGLQVRPMGSYNKKILLDKLGLSNNFTPTITAIIGSKSLK